MSFEFEGNNTYKKDTTTNQYVINGNEESDNVIQIYEPNVDVHNTAIEPNNENANRAIIEKLSTSTNPLKGYDETLYDTIKQKANKSFKIDETNTEQREDRSSILCTIKENQPVKVTMRVWIEGSDPDCVNDIAASQILGQIQFTSEENFYDIEQQTTAAAP